MINQRGKLNANSAVVGETGKIILKASRDTLLEAGSVTSATGAGQGGEVQVLGQRVALTGDARIDASGETGGGTVLVGGDYQGKNAAVQNAEQTVVGADASIKADAIARGDGGKIIVWADGATSMAGSLSARGGAAGGNGGLAEASGKQFLDFRGTADLRAPLGKKGTLLLDPNNITIGNGSDSAMSSVGGSPFVYEANNSSALLSTATLTTQLSFSDVNVYTGTGSIVVLDPISWANSSELTLSATTGIAINAQITNSDGGKLSLYTTGGNITQTSRISVATLAAIADSGSVNLTHNGNQVGTLAGSGATGFSYRDSDALTIGTVAGGAIPTQVGVSSSSGSIEIMSGIGQVSGGLDIDGSLSAASGTINLRDYKGDINQTAAIYAPSALIIADEGAVTLNNTANSVNTLAGYSNAPGGFHFTNSSGLTVGTVGGSNGVISFGTGALSLTALTGDLAIENTTYGVMAGNTGNFAITLTASNGQVQGVGLVKGGAVTINSATGINLAGANNQIASLTASVTGSGNVVVVNDKALSIASISTGSANALVDISTTAGSAFGIEVAGAISTSAAGSVSLNAGGTGAITRSGASSVISTNNLVLQDSSSGAIGTVGSPLLTAAVGGGTTDVKIGASSAAGPQGLYLGHTGKMTLNAGSKYGNNTAVNINASSDLAIAGNLNAGSGALTLNSGGNLSSDNSSVITGGNVNLSATQNIAVGTVNSSSGNISMSAQQALTARGISTAALNAGNVTLTANGGDIILGADSGLDARSTSSGSNGTVSLTSAGAIQMLNSNVIKAGALDLKAANGIYGSSNANALNIISDSVQAQNTSTGPIRLANSTTNMSVGGSSNYGIQQQGSGDVFLSNASGSSTINKAVSTAGGNISIDAANGLTLSSNVNSAGGNVALTVAGNATSELAILQAINAGSGNITLTSSGAVYGGTGSNDISAGTLSITANGTSTRNGIGAIDGDGGLHTTVPRIAALTATMGGIRVQSLSDLVVGPATPAAGNVVNTGGTLELATLSGHSMTINGGVNATGDIKLTAGSGGSTNTSDKINFMQSVTSSGGNISINANSTSGSYVPSGGNVSSNLYIAPKSDVIPSQPGSVLAQALNSNINIINSGKVKVGCGASTSLSAISNAAVGASDDSEEIGGQGTYSQQTSCN
ncbi:hypothetical protein D3C72_532460 [compost metagenome]